jgi:hypothetical protein
MGSALEPFFPRLSTGAGIRYRSNNQLSKSINLQRSLQKGRYGLPS